MIQITEHHLSRMKVPKKHWGCQLSKIPDHCEHKAFIAEYTKNIAYNVSHQKGLLLFGNYSTGKSGTAAIIAKAAMSQGIWSCWLVGSRMPKYEIEKTMFDDNITMEERVQSVPLLIIDELILQDHRYTENSLERLVRSRIDDELCTIITTNLLPYKPKNASAQQIAKIKGNTIEDRFPAMWAALSEAVLPKQIKGHDFRKGQQVQFLIDFKAARV